MKPKILIIGSGIGGLTAAIALRQANFDAAVYERALELKEVGAGIALSPNAMRVLKHLGLMQQVMERGTEIKAAVGYRSNGRQISRLATNLADVPSVCLHRADLQRVLLSALPPDFVHLGEQFVDLKQTAVSVTAHFANGHSATGDALVGADGLRSKVRARLLNDGAPIYRGYQCWRGVCSFQTDDVLTETFGRGVRIGIVPLGRRGTAWWCCANEPEDAIDHPECAKSKLTSWLENWHRPIPDILSATDPKEIIKTGVYDRRPVGKWSDGRCTLLGDAAHPTTPNMGQGGCMAIEDAAVLARSTTQHNDPMTSFRAYEHLRHARTARVTNISRSYGVIGQSKNPVVAWFRSALFRLGSGKAAAKNYAKFVSYDPYEVPLGAG